MRTPNIRLKMVRMTLKMNTTRPTAKPKARPSLGPTARRGTNECEAALSTISHARGLVVVDSRHTFDRFSSTGQDFAIQMTCWNGRSGAKEFGAKLAPQRKMCEGPRPHTSRAYAKFRASLWPPRRATRSLASGTQAKASNRGGEMMFSAQSLISSKVDATRTTPRPSTY